MIYKISIDKKAQKFILKQPKSKQNLIYKAIYTKGIRKYIPDIDNEYLKKF